MSQAGQEPMWQPISQQERDISFLHCLNLQGIDFRGMTKIAQEIGPDSQTDVTQKFCDFSRDMPIHTCQEIWPSPFKWQLQDVYHFMMRFILSSTFCGISLLASGEQIFTDESLTCLELSQNLRRIINLFFHSRKGKRNSILSSKISLVYWRS